jgi:SAM-dependent methyltransferase
VAEWWEEAFRADYLRVYPHRDDDEAVAAVARARSLVPGLRPGARVLDLACGAGRHLRAMASGGLRAVGADLSADLLAEARRRGARDLVRCDMRRLPFRGATFGAVTLFFSSFGYFGTPEEDASVLRESSRVLAPGGGLFLDLPWPTSVRRALVPRSERTVDGVRIVEERTLADDGKFVRKRVTLHRGGEVRSWTESLRLYTRVEVLRMASSAGFREAPRTRTRPSEDGRAGRMPIVLVKAAA